MTRIIFIRHGQSEANFVRIGGGQRNYPLTELGRAQARLAAKYLLKNEKIDAVYSSDLCRAVDTALPVADALGLTVMTDKRLREVDTGAFAGMHLDDRELNYPKEFKLLQTDFSHMRYPNGEYVPDVYDRVSECVCEIARANVGKTVLIAAHGGTIHIFDAFARGYSREETGKAKGVGNTAINIYECDGTSASVIRTNITDHLSEDPDDVPDTDKQ